MKTYAVVLLVLLTGCQGKSVVKEYQALQWIELIPEDQITYQQQLTEFEHEALAGPQAGLSQVTMRTEFNGDAVKLPGFVVPLELDNERVYQYLLVPYHGACVHVPPPPANQILHVYSEDGLPIELTHDPIWVSGTIHTAALDFDVAQVGYTLEMDSAYFYDSYEQDYGGGISTTSFYEGVIDSVFN